MTRRQRPYDGIDYGYTGPVGAREQVRDFLLNIANARITDEDATADRHALDALYGEIVAAGVHVLRDWPWQAGTSAGLTADLHHEADYQRIAEAHGTKYADRWRLLRERELWTGDPRNPRAGVSIPDRGEENDAAPRRSGRPLLTEARVRADLVRALASLAEEGRTHPGWDALAAKHDGRTEFGLTVDALRRRRARFPAPFLELVPDLPE